MTSKWFVLFPISTYVKAKSFNNQWFFNRITMCKKIIEKKQHSKRLF